MFNSNSFRFKAAFHGVVYIYGRHRDCILFSVPPGSAPSATVSFRLIKNTCPQYSTQANLATALAPSLNTYRIMVQFDPYLVSKEDVNFVVDCKTYAESSGKHEPTVKYTVVDDNPVVLTVSLYLKK